MPKTDSDQKLCRNHDLEVSKVENRLHFLSSTGTLTAGILDPRTGRENPLLLLKSRSPWHFVMVALAD